MFSILQQLRETIECPGYKEDLEDTKVEEIKVCQAVGEMFVAGDAVLRMLGFISVSVFAKFLQISHQDPNQKYGKGIE